MVAVQEFKLQVVPLTYPGLKFSSGLNERALSDLVEHLHFLYDFLLILNHLILLINLRLDPSYLNLLLIGLELNESL
jgi:hypothetical protein